MQILIEKSCKAYVRYEQVSECRVVYSTVHIYYSICCFNDASRTFVYIDLVASLDFDAANVQTVCLNTLLISYGKTIIQTFVIATCVSNKPHTHFHCLLVDYVFDINRNNSFSFFQGPIRKVFGENQAKTTFTVKLHIVYPSKLSSKMISIRNVGFVFGFILLLGWIGVLLNLINAPEERSSIAEFLKTSNKSVQYVSGK